MSAAEKRAAYISGLRKLADLLEQHEDFPLPYGAGTSGEMASYRMSFYLFGDSREAFVSAARKFPGTLDKVVADDTFRLNGQIEGLHFELVAFRKDVCERVVTGTREVTRTIPDPTVVVPTVPMVEVTETVEDVEWVCAPLLAEAGA